MVGTTCAVCQTDEWNNMRHVSNWQLEHAPCVKRTSGTTSAVHQTNRWNNTCRVKPTVGTRTVCQTDGWNMRCVSNWQVEQYALCVIPNPCGAELTAKKLLVVVLLHHWDAWMKGKCCVTPPFLPIIQSSTTKKQHNRSIEPITIHVLQYTKSVGVIQYKETTKYANINYPLQSTTLHKE